MKNIEQPKPIFFTEEELKRMSEQEGAYQYKGESDGKKADS